MLDDDLGKVARFIFQQFQEQAENGTYIIYDPRDIFIDNKGRVRCEQSAKIKTANNVCDGLYALGVTLYHLATGRSSYNEGGFVYEPFKSKMWPLLRLLLSQSAASLPQVEAMLKPPPAIKRLANGALKPIIMAMLWLIALAGQGVVLTFKWLMTKAGDVYPQTKKTATKLLKLLKLIKRKFSLIIYITLIVIAVASFICLAVVNIAYFSFSLAWFCGLLIIVASFILGATVSLMCAMLTNMTEDDCISRGFFVFLILITSLSIYEVFETPTAGFCPPLVVIDRSNGNLIGRIADSGDKHYIPHYENAYVNLFTRSYAPGIIIQREGIPVEVPLDNDKNGEKFCFWIKYAITDQATFESDWKRMMKNKQTQADLEQELINAGQTAAKKAITESGAVKPLEVIDQELSGITVEAKGADGTLSEVDYQVIRDVTVNLVRNELLSRRQKAINNKRRGIMDNIQNQLREQFQDQYNYLEIKEPRGPGEMAAKQTQADSSASPCNPPAKVMAEQEAK